MWNLSPDIDLSNDNIPATDAERQLRTADEILRRLNSQPGLVLADEVGMGKTFVALAVAASVVRATNYEQQVVVMVPPSVVDKWPREWRVFAKSSLDDPSSIRVSGAIRHGTDFLKLLDDPADRRKHIIFLTHGALNRTVSDPFVRLSLLRKAVGKRAELQNRIPAIVRDAAKLVGDKRFGDPYLVQKLLSASESRWMQLWNAHSTSKPLDDDPVPDAFVKAVNSSVLEPLREALLKLPIKHSKTFDDRLQDAKAALTAAMKDAWSTGLSRLDVSLPLLILDEAHHVKNDNTMSSLFANEALDGDVGQLKGALGGMFERMLFLTATPFQLGHHELLSVLGRFDGVRWEAPTERSLFAENQEALRLSLDTAQMSTQRFQKRWSALDPVADHQLSHITDLGTVDLDSLTPAGEAAVNSAKDAEAATRSAETLLRPWVIRHLKPNDIERRRYRAGASVLPGGSPEIGLPVDGGAALPFLLAGRADSVARLTRSSTDSTRSLFSYGIASSFEAYRRTRSTGVAAVDDSAVSETPSTDATTQVSWYLDRIEETLPDQPELLAKHPKVNATVEATVKLWSRGHKTLIFCFYRETGRALRLHVARAIEKQTVDLARTALAMQGQTDDEVHAALDRLSDRLLRSGTNGSQRVSDAVRVWSSALEPAERDRLVEVVIRFLRTDSFLVRFASPRQEMTVDDLMTALENSSLTGVTLRERVQAFAQFLARREDEDRIRILDILRTTKTGDITIEDIDPAEHSPQHQTVAPTVRLANGEVAQATRQNLMAAFNSPFFPDVLVASSVMAEGVDLHTACRHVIHHDLDWNPATLEQRTGRLDRLGSAALLEGQPVIVYEPYLAGTHDEKMYRVVKDRERWFGVVMGDTRTSGGSGDPADQLPLPAALAAQLTMDLAVSGSDNSTAGSPS